MLVSHLSFVLFYIILFLWFPFTRSYLLIVVSNYTDWSTAQLTKHKNEIESQLGNYFLRVSSPKIFARSVLFSSGTENANGVTPGANGDDGVSVWDGLPEDLKALFTTHASRSTTTTSYLEQDKSNDGIVIDENESVDPNHTLLKLTLALEDKVDRHMEQLEAGLALNEVMSVLKMVHTSSPCFIFEQLTLIVTGKQNIDRHRSMVPRHISTSRAYDAHCGTGDPPCGWKVFSACHAWCGSEIE